MNLYQRFITWLFPPDAYEQFIAWLHPPEAPIEAGQQWWQPAEEPENPWCVPWRGAEVKEVRDGWVRFERLLNATKLPEGFMRAGESALSLRDFRRRYPYRGPK